MADQKNYEKYTPTHPPGAPGPNPNHSVQTAPAESTWRHASEFNKSKWEAAEKKVVQLDNEMSEYKEIERLLRPPGSDLTLRESLRLLAEIFVYEYPEENAEVVIRLISLFTRPVEEALLGKGSIDADAGESLEER